MSQLAVSEIEDSSARRRAGGLATSRKDSVDVRTPFELWHLLSMDAPTVALCWTAFTASAAGLRLPVVSEVAMWLAVWTLYAADRLFDTRHLATGESCGADLMEARHLFHSRYRGSFWVGIVVSLLGLCVLLPMLPAATLRLFAVEGVLMAGYFAAVHSASGSRRSENTRDGRLPKELLVGPFFAAAVFIPTISRRPELRLGLLPLAVLFGGLCSLNCLSIFAWERPRSVTAPVGTGWAVHRLETLTWLFVGLSVGIGLLPVSDGLWPISFRIYALACAGSGMALAACGHCGSRLSRTTLRAAADACLLTPLLVLPFLHNR